MSVVLALHLISMVAWFAGLFYLPRLFVYHAAATDVATQETFKVMEHKLFHYIMTPSAVLTAVFGFTLWFQTRAAYWHATWMWMKLAAVFCLWVYHGYCGYLVKRFARDDNPFSSRFYRFFNEVPTLFLVLIIFLVILNTRS